MFKSHLFCAFRISFRVLSRFKEYREVETEQAKNKIASDFERKGIAKDKYKWDESAVQRG